MTYKEKYEDLDRSKLPEKALVIIDAMREDTNNFTDEEALEVVGAKFDAVLSKLKQSGYDEAFKSLQKKEPTPVTPQAKAKQVIQKHVKQPKTAKGKVSISQINKGEIAKLAKEIRKDGEKWTDALKRAGEIFRSQKAKVQSTAQKQYQKLSNFLKLMPQYKKGTDVERDAPRKALPPGLRISKKTNKPYYESRANRSDVRQGKGFPYLELGGAISQAKKLAGAGQFSKGVLVQSKKHRND